MPKQKLWSESEEFYCGLFNTKMTSPAKGVETTTAGFLSFTTEIDLKRLQM